MLWSFMITRSTMWISPGETTSMLSESVVAYASLAAIATLAILVLFRRRFSRFTTSKGVLVAAAAIGTLGGLTMIADGPAMLRSLSGVVPPIVLGALFPLGAVLFGVASSLLFVRIACIYAHGSAIEALLYALLSEVAFALLYCMVSALSTICPIEGVPPVAVIIACLAMPPLIAWLASLDASYATDATDERVLGPKGRKAFIVLTSLLLLCSTISSMGQGYYSYLEPLESAFSDSILIAFARMVIAIFFIELSLRYAHAVKLESVYLVLIIVIALVTAMAPVLEMYNRATIDVVLLLHDLFTLLTWVLLCCISIGLGVNPVVVFGIGRIGELAGNLAGFGIGSSVIPFMQAASVGASPCFWAAIAALAISCLAFANADFRALVMLSPDSSGLFAELSKPAHRRDAGDLANKAAPWLRACDRIAQHYRLSSREREVLIEASKGQSPQTISNHLGISKNTVRTHMGNLYGKLNVHSRQELHDMVESEMGNSSSR